MTFCVNSVFCSLQGIVRPMRYYFFLAVLFGFSLCLTSCLAQDERASAADVSQIKPVLTMPDAPVFQSVREGTPEELLAAEGNWNLVEQGNEYDPAKAHLEARSKVNPNKYRKREDLVAQFEPDAKSGQDGKLRVLRLEPQGDGWEKELEGFADIQVAETSIAKPTLKVASVETQSKIRALFENPQNIKPQILSADLETVESISRVVPEDVSDDTVLHNARDAGFGSGAYMIGGVVVPPDAPARKKSVTGAFPPVMRAPSVARDVEVPEDVVSRVQLAQVQSQVQSQVQPRAQTNLRKPNIRYQMVSPAQNSKDIAQIEGIRSGAHPDKVRITIDVSATVKYKVAVDQIRNVLRIKLERAKWSINPQGVMTGSPMLGSYVAKPQLDGSTLIEIRLKKKTKILDTLLLRPNASFKHRVVIDLAK